eukprot:m.59728 g.59728  ORF g.59728 m.59728 type:complete len:500 (+) comp11779_c0_seq1:115-1614(+)
MATERDALLSIQSKRSGTVFVVEETKKGLKGSRDLDLEGSRRVGGDAGSESVAVEELKAYSQRWYLLFLCCVGTLMQGMIWNNYGPIQLALDPVLALSDQTVALLANWGPICFMVSFLPSAYLLARGIRVSMIVCMILLTVSCVAKSYTLDNPAATALIHIGQVFNGLAGPLAMSMGPTLSASWFPLNERVTATALVSVFNYIGVSLSFVVGPLLVKEHAGRITGQDQLDISWSYFAYMWGQSVICIVVLFASIFYFPNTPPTAPTQTASHSRETFGTGIKKVLKCKQFWIVAVAYGSLLGCFSGWSAYLLPNVKHYLPPESAQKEVGWLGFYSNMAGCLVGILVSAIADKLHGAMTRLLQVGCFAAGAFTFWFTYICQFKEEGDRGVHTSIYISAILLGMFSNSTIPLFYEAAVEVTYPVDEGTGTTVLTSLNNIFCLLYLIMPSIIKGNVWVNWALFGACLLSFLLMLLFRGELKRSNIDRGEDSAEGDMETQRRDT